MSSPYWKDFIVNITVLSMQVKENFQLSNVIKYIRILVHILNKVKASQQTSSNSGFVRLRSHNYEFYTFWGVLTFPHNPIKGIFGWLLGSCIIKGLFIMDQWSAIIIITFSWRKRNAEKNYPSPLPPMPIQFGNFNYISLLMKFLLLSPVKIFFRCRDIFTSGILLFRVMSILYSVGGENRDHICVLSLKRCCSNIFKICSTDSELEIGTS